MSCSLGGSLLASTLVCMRTYRCKTVGAVKNIVAIMGVPVGLLEAKRQSQLVVANGLGDLDGIGLPGAVPLHLVQEPFPVMGAVIQLGVAVFVLDDAAMQQLMIDQGAALVR